MRSWFGDWQRRLKRREQGRRPRPIPHSRPTLEALEDRSLPSITTYSYTAQFVAGATPAQATPVLTFLNNQESPANPGNYTAQISWGDGTSLDSTSATITLLSSGSEGNMYQVVGTHSYANPGSYTITVTLHDQATNQTLDGVSLAEVVTPNQHFVQAIYETLLGRPADSSGFITYTTELQNGASRLQIVQQLMNSSEYQARVVDQVYEEVLGRAPDAAGLSTWTNFLANGGTADQLEASLLGSQEYFNTQGQSNAAFLQAVYQVLLHRTIDPAGTQLWTNALNDGTSRAAVASLILSSTEGNQVEVEGLYEQILDRSADSSGLQTWSSALQSGETREQIIANLVASDEYFANEAPVSTPNQATLQDSQL